MTTGSPSQHVSIIIVLGDKLREHVQKQRKQKQAMVLSNSNVTIDEEHQRIRPMKKNILESKPTPPTVFQRCTEKYH